MSDLQVRPRADWEAVKPVDPPMPMSGSSNGWFIHWPGSDYGERDTPSVLQSIQEFHMGPDRGFDDIGYSWAIDLAGVVWECRGVNTTGAHTKGYNSSSYGVLFIINIGEEPTKLMFDAFNRLRRQIYETTGHPLTPVRPHKAVSPGNKCPGPHLTAFAHNLNTLSPSLVGSVQQRLNDIIDAGLSVDNVFGPNTSVAVHQALDRLESFEADNRLPAITPEQAAVLAAVRRLNSYTEN